MAAHKDTADIEETFDAAELREAMWLLPGSDPENCSYPQVRKTF